MKNPKSKRIVATIEARTTSSRLPGKVLLPLSGIPALEFMIRRVRRCDYLSDVVVACTTNVLDDPISSLCERIGCTCFRGSEDDVLSRVLGAAQEAAAETIVELTGDCPFADPGIISEVIELYFSGDYEYASNTVIRSYPDGLDTQVFSSEDLEKVSRLTSDPIDRVHVSSYFYRTPGAFKLANLHAPPDMFWPDLGLTLDERRDYEFLNALVDRMGPSPESMKARDILAVLRDAPELLAINKAVRRKGVNEG